MELLKKFADRISTRSLVVLLLVSAAAGLAVIDPAFRPSFGDLAKVGVGGYLGQLFPRKEN